MCTYCMFVVCMWGMMAVSFDLFYVLFDVLFMCMLLDVCVLLDVLFNVCCLL